MSISKAIGATISFVSGLWIPCTLLCCIPWVQKQMLYLHNFTFFPGRWLTEPERAGFLKNQVTPFYITTKDDEKLISWLIAPLGVYAKHVEEFVQEKSAFQDIEEKVAFQLLKHDPEARLLLYFHGNSATIAQERRTQEYRSYSAGASDKIFVLAFDYRGFGKSSGNPTESGLLHDADAIVDWALNVACIPPERIVLLGHSLGTAVATGIAHQYLTESNIEFAGLILAAAFTNAGNAFASYSIGGVVPVLAPVKLIPSFHAWFTRHMRDTWHSDDRIVYMAQNCSRFQLVLVHAEDDDTMPWYETEALFKAAIEAARARDTGDVESRRVVDLGEAGRQEVWQRGPHSISKTIAKHGGHNVTMVWSPVALTILQLFRLADPAAHA